MSFQHDAFQHNAFQVGAEDAGPGFFLDEDTPGLPVRAPPWGWAIPQRQAVSDDEPIFASPSHGPSGGHRIIILPGVRARLSWWEDDGLAVAAAVALEDEPFLPQPPPGPGPVRSLFFDEDVLPNFILFEEEQFLPQPLLGWKFASPFLDDDDLVPSVQAPAFEEELDGPHPTTTWRYSQPISADEEVLPLAFGLEENEWLPGAVSRFPPPLRAVEGEDEYPTTPVVFGLEEDYFWVNAYVPWLLVPPATLADEDWLSGVVPPEPPVVAPDPWHPYDARKKPRKRRKPEWMLRDEARRCFETAVDCTMREVLYGAPVPVLEEIEEAASPTTVRAALAIVCPDLTITTEDLRLLKEELQALCRERLRVRKQEADDDEDLLLLS